MKEEVPQRCNFIRKQAKGKRSEAYVQEVEIKLQINNHFQRILFTKSRIFLNESWRMIKFKINH